MTKELHEVKMRIHGKSQKALLLSDTGEEKDARWLPLSQIETESIRGDATHLLVTMPTWLAEREGLV